METRNEIQEKVLHSELIIKGSDHDKETDLLDAELKVFLTNRTLSNDGDVLEAGLPAAKVPSHPYRKPRTSEREPEITP